MNERTLINLIKIISTIHLVDTNYVKSMLDRNNVVNKGLWMRNNAETKNPGDFIFRANSLDVDSVLQNNFDAFGDNNVQNSPFLTSYIERYKRSPVFKAKPHINEKNERCKNKSQCLNTDEQTASMVKSKIISTLRPGSVFINFPHAVAALINNRENENNITKEFNREHTKNAHRTTNNLISPELIKINEDNAIIGDKDDSKRTLDALNTTSFIKRGINDTVVIPRRKHRYEPELLEDIEFKEINNTESDKNNAFKNVFDKEDIAWQNSAPISNVNVYKVLPQSRDNIKNKPITERGLVKVLSMLTKTFKKIMKQHSDIKRIHKRLYNLNDDFIKNVELLTTKFEDFNSKYNQIMKVDQDLKQMVANLMNKEQNYHAKEREISRNLVEFQDQQKKFLAQQRQFYNVQKLMLAQNEKINLKQNIIAKTQSEISHRQNNFARILKKAKQVYIDTKNFPSKLNTGINKPKTISVKEKFQPADSLTSSTTESLKINVFSIPTTKSIRNQDEILLNEKDKQPIDDLIYKYYFNNTFIDEIMKNKILSTFLAENGENSKKSKRNEHKLSSTILLPVNKSINNSKNRQRRWIKHSKKNANKNISTTSVPKSNIVEKGSKVAKDFSNVDIKNTKSDPFVTMALKFCKEIGQDVDIQSLNWCVEKALRRLRVLDFKLTSIIQKPKEFEKHNEISNPTSTSETPSTLKLETPIVPVTTEASQINFFPDNDDLESKLKEYELQPDTEGNVYYDGSLHSSDLGRTVKVDSEGFSDLMPGLDSDSRVQVDPVALDLQAQRRAEVRKINARIMKMRLG